MSDFTLISSNEQLELLYRTARIGLCVLDADLRIRFINDELAKLNGICPTEHLGKTFVDVVPQIAESILPTIQKVLATGEPVKGLEICTGVPDASDKPHTWSDDIYPVKNEEGEVQGVTCVVQDITDRRRVELDLQEKSRILETILDCIPDGVAVIDEKGQWLHLNPAARQLIRFEAPAKYPDDWPRHYGLFLADGKTLHPADHLPLARALRGENVIDADVFVRNANVPEGALFSVNATPLVDADQRLRGGLAVFRDVTHQRTAEAALRESEAIFRDRVDTLPVFIWMMDTQGICSFVNQSLLDMTGTTLEESVGEGWTRLVHPDDLGHIQNIFGDAFQNRKDFEGECRTRTADSSYRWIFYHGKPRYGPSGAFEGYIGSATDVTQRRDLERQVSDAAAAEQRRIGLELHDNVGQLLTGVGYMAHSLLEDLRLSSLPQADVAARINQEIKRATEQVRLLAKGLVPVDVESDGLMAALGELAAGVSDMTTVDCQFECAEPIPITDNQTATQLFRIAQEAVNNAVRHGRPQEIRISLQSQNSQTVLEIYDNGPGIQAEDLEGNGKGLWIMRYRAGLINGTFSVAPSGGGGTLVSCSFPSGV